MVGQRLPIVIHRPRPGVAQLLLIPLLAPAVLCGCRRAVPPRNPTALEASPTVEAVTVKARCKRVHKSGKRLQSYRFVFTVLQVLEGPPTQKTIELQELSDDDGGGTLAAATKTSGPYMGQARCRGVVVLRLRRSRNGLEFVEFIG